MKPGIRAPSVRPLAKGYSCETCGVENKYSGWVYAHWRDLITHSCDCGAKYSIFAGIARQVKKGRRKP